MNLKIYEIDYSVSPGGINQFEVYDENELLFSSTYLIDACLYAYGIGRNFEVYTLAEFHKEFDLVNPALGMLE